MSSLANGARWACRADPPKVVIIKKRAPATPSSIRLFTEASFSALGVEGTSSILCEGGNRDRPQVVSVHYNRALSDMGLDDFSVLTHFLLGRRPGLALDEVSGPRDLD